MQASDIRYNILFLAKWYPNKFDPQLGVFIQKHANAVSAFCNVNVLYVCPENLIRTNYSSSISNEHGFEEIIIYYKRDYSFLRLFINAYRYTKANLMGIKEVQRHLGNIDLIHVNVLNRPGLIALLIKRIKKIPYVVTEHWTGYVSGNYQKGSFLKKWIAKKIIKNADAVTTVSENLKNSMLELGLNNNYTIIANVIEPVELSATVTDNKKIKILTIGDLLDDHKNISDILKSIANISKKNSAIEYHIIGGGPDKEKLFNLSNSLGLTNKFVFFHGRQKNEFVYNFLKQIDFVVINSNRETFSVVAAEALANGKPVITTICGGPEEFITSDYGILIEKGNQKQLENAIVKMIATYKNYDAQKLNQYITGKFNSQTIGKQFYELYKSVITKSIKKDK